MSYLTRENSNEEGSPLYLYEFSTRDTTYRFVDNPISLDAAGETWEPLAITHTEVKNSNEISKNSIKIELKRTDGEFQSLFNGWTPDGIVTFTLFRTHVGETEVLTYWKGRVSSVGTLDETITLSCESIFTSLKRAGVRGRFQRNCRHSLYSTRCGVVQDDYSHATEIDSVSGLTLTTTNASDFANGYFTGGIILFTDGSTRQIDSHTGDVITVTRTSRTIEEEAASPDTFNATLYPGCDRTLATCISKFDNVLNQGGFKWIPTKNPFAGSSIV